MTANEGDAEELTKKYWFGNVTCLSNASRKLL